MTKFSKHRPCQHSRSYPHEPFRFVRREYSIITYETDPNAIRTALPAPLEPAAGALAFYEWMKMPDASGFGDYEESGTGIYATFKGEPCNFSVQMYLDDEPPITVAERSGASQRSTEYRASK